MDGILSITITCAVDGCRNSYEVRIRELPDGVIGWHHQDLELDGELFWYRESADLEVDQIVYRCAVHRSGQMP